MTVKQRILVIDDSPLVVAAVREALSEDHVEIEGVTDLSALDVATRLDGFDLILIDVQMPEMFGDDVAMVMRQGRSVSAPIVLLSSLPEPQLAARAKEAGVDGFISKQRGADGVADEIRGWLDGRTRSQRGGA